MKIFISVMLFFIVVQYGFCAPVKDAQTDARRQASDSEQELRNIVVNTGDNDSAALGFQKSDFQKMSTDGSMFPSQIEKQDAILPTDDSIDDADDDKDSTLMYMTNFIAPDIIGLHKAEMEHPTFEHLNIDKEDFPDELDFTTHEFQIGGEDDLRFTKTIRIATEKGLFMAPWPEEELVKQTPLLLAIQTALQENQKVRLQRITGYLNKTPSDKDGYHCFLKWICYLALNDMENAKKSLIDLILTRISNSKRVYWWNYLYLGRLEFVLGNFPQAALAFKQAIDMNPDRASLYLYAGRASYRAEQPNKAKRYYLLGLSKTEDDRLKMQFITFLCEFYASCDAWNDIVELLAPYIGRNDLRPILVLNYIRALRQQGRVDEIEAILKQRIAVDSNNELWYFNLAQFYWVSERKDEALSLLSEKYESDPSLVGIGMRLARYNRQQGNIDKTESILQKIITEKPDAVIAIIRLAQLYYSQNKMNDAADLFKKALDKNPDNPEIIFFLGRIYEQEKQFKAMKEYFQLYLEKFPDGKRVGHVKTALDKLTHIQEGL